MNFLQNRIDSFSKSAVKWPYNDKENYPSVKSFAEAGFSFPYRPKTPDTVRCFSCKIELGNWRPKQSPFKRHEDESPHCAYSRLNFPAASNRSASTVAFINNTPRSENMRLARLSTFKDHHYWPHEKSTGKYLTGAKLAAAGFFFNPTITEPARVQCVYCKLALVPTNEDMLKKHQELSSGCPFFKPTYSTRQSSVKSNIIKNSMPSIKRSSSSVSTNSETGTNESKNKRQKGSIKIDGSQKSKLVPSSRRAKSKLNSTVKVKNNDDSISDFNNVLDSSEQVRRPIVTYGSHRPVHRLLSTRRTSGADNILPDFKSSLTVKPVTGPLVDVSSAKQASSSNPPNKAKEPEEAAGRNIIKKKVSASSNIKTHVLDNVANASSKRDISHVMEQAESSTSTKQVKTNNEAAPSSPVKNCRDKGKGREFEHNYYNSNPVKDPISSPVVKKCRDKGKGRAFEHNYYNLNPVKDPFSSSNSKNKNCYNSKSVKDPFSSPNSKNKNCYNSKSVKDPFSSSNSKNKNCYNSKPAKHSISLTNSKNKRLPLGDITNLFNESPSTTVVSLSPPASSPLLPHVPSPLLPPISSPLLPHVSLPLLSHASSPLLPPLLPHVSSPLLPHASPPLLPHVSSPILPHVLPSILPQVPLPLSAPVSSPVLKNDGDVFFHMDPQQVQSPKLLPLSERFLKKKPSRRLSLPINFSPVVMSVPPPPPSPPYEIEEDTPIRQDVSDELYPQHHNPSTPQPPVDIQTPEYIPRSPSPFNL